MAWHAAVNRAAHGRFRHVGSNPILPSMIQQTGTYGSENKKKEEKRHDSSI